MGSHKIGNNNGGRVAIVNKDVFVGYKEVMYLNTVDDMSILTGVNVGDVAQVSEDGRGGTFNWTGDNTLNDGGVHFNGWKRDYDELMLDYFITDEADVAGALVSASLVGDIHLGDRDYNLETEALIANGVSIIGGGSKSRFIMGTNGTIKFWHGATSGGYMTGVNAKDFVMVGADNTATGIITYLTTSSRFSNIRFEKMDKCFVQRRTSTTLITDCGNTNIEDGATDSNYFVWADDTLPERSNDNIYSFNKVRTRNETLFLGSNIAGGSQDGANVHGNIFFPNQNGSIIYINNSRWSTIENNKIFVAAKHGIELKGPIHVTVSNNVLAWCGRREVGNGIHCYSLAGGYVTTYGDLNISDNQIVQPIGHGIYVQRVRSGTIANNLIANPSDPSHYIGTPSSGEGEGNFDGIRIEEVYNFSISNNNITTTRDGSSGDSKTKTWNLDINETDCLYLDTTHTTHTGTKSVSFVDGELVNENLGVTNLDPSITIKNLSVSLGADENVGALDFYSSDVTGLGAGVKGSISIKSVDSSGYSYYMSFATTFGEDTNNKEVMRLDHTGQLFPATDSTGALGKSTARWKDVFLDLPIADPSVAGQLWNNAGVVTVSAG